MWRFFNGKKVFNMKQNIKQSFETLAVGALCTVFVLSMHQSCSGLSKKFSKTQEKTEIKKAPEKQILLNNLNQKIR